MRTALIVVAAVGACSGNAVTGSGVVSFATVSAGTSHTCGVTTTGRAYCWGDNAFGEMGKGDTTGTSSMCSTTSCNPTPIPVSGGLGFRAVSSGFEHTCGLTTAGAAYCWGSNFEGALGNGAAPSTTPISTTPVAVSGGIRFSQLDASTGSGSVYTCAVTSAEELYCWGEGTDGELGNGSKTSSGTPSRVSVGLSFVAVSAGGYHTCGVTNTGAAYCWGRNASGQLGTGDTTERAAPAGVFTGLRFVDISAGGDHTCALTSAGVAYCWGKELADGSAISSNLPVAVSGGLTFTELSSGGLIHTCGVTTTGDAYCWGDNASGQLGNGTPNGSFTPVLVVVK